MSEIETPSELKGAESSELEASKPTEDLAIEPSAKSAINGDAASVEVPTGSSKNTAKTMENDKELSDEKDPGTNDDEQDDIESRSSKATTEKSFAENHSNRRLIIYNIHKYMDTRRMKKATSEWIQAMSKQGTQIEITKIKKPPRDQWVLLTLQDESMVQPFVDYINNNNITNKRGDKLVAKRADETDEDNNLKRKAGDSNTGDKTKRQRVQEEMPVARRPVTEDEVRAKVTPLWKLSPEEHKTTKMRGMIKNCAIKIIKEVKARFRTLEREKGRKNVRVYDWVTKKRCIDVKDLVSAPTPLRNKSEFTFGYRYILDENDSEEHTKVPEVGFMATGWAGGVSSPHCCANIPSEACAIADLVNTFLSTSPLLPYDSKVHTGFWKTLTIRSSRRTKEVMVIVMHESMVSRDGSDYSEYFDKEKERLVSLLTAAELPVKEGQIEGETPLKVTSIFFQEFDGLSSPPPEHPVQHVFGKTSLHERLGKCTFQISPGAFFQVNTEGAELLYQIVVDAVREISPNPENTLLFDVCCGTGTIGLTCLKEGVVNRIVGVDISSPAIEDAKVNAGLNGFASEDGASEPRTRFVAARAEHVLAKEIGKAKNSQKRFVAVVDPARDGLHPEVIKTLRSNERIRRIVYVSCNPTATLVRDAGLLCGPPTKRYTGQAFQVTSAAPVDMFPLTNHCEMVMTFDRLKDDSN